MSPKHAICCILVIILICIYATYRTHNLQYYAHLQDSTESNTKDPESIQKKPFIKEVNQRNQTSKHTDLKFIEFKQISITEGMTIDGVAKAFQSLCNQKQIECLQWKLYGKNNVDWAVCIANAFLPKKPCVIYSFGINYDWSFDEMYHKKHGCTVRSFDPSMGGTPEHEHLPGIPFYPIGLSGRKEIHKTKGWKMDNMKGLLSRFQENNKTIPYLKFDIETSEWGVLDNLLQDGSLKNVMQLAFEIHVDTAKNYRKYFKLIKGLELIGFRRWYVKRRGGRFLYQSDQSYININYLYQKQ